LQSPLIFQIAAADAATHPAFQPRCRSEHRSVIRFTCQRSQSFFPPASALLSAFAHQTTLINILVHSLSAGSVEPSAAILSVLLPNSIPAQFVDDHRRSTRLANDMH
jgi:hypothetical protein